MIWLINLKMFICSFINVYLNNLFVCLMLNAGQVTIGLTLTVWSFIGKFLVNVHLIIIFLNLKNKNNFSKCNSSILSRDSVPLILKDVNDKNTNSSFNAFNIFYRVGRIWVQVVHSTWLCSTIEIDEKMFDDLRKMWCSTRI